jgi:RND family efflux transporter MFP subunit
MLKTLNNSWTHLRRLAAVAAVGVALSGCSSEPETARPPRIVKAMQVVEASTFATRSFPGRAKAGQEVNLSFRVGGPLIELPVSVGRRVSQGDLVAQIDPTDYQSVVTSLEAQLQSAQAAANRAQADFDRIDRTFREDPGATTEMALDQARQLRDSTAATARSAAATLQGARDQLSYTSLTAPFSGEVVETYVENFETVIPKQPVLRIVDPTRIEFTISVPENLIGYAPYVTDAKVAFDSLPDLQVPAEIKEISTEASQATRTYPVTLSMERPEGVSILPGMAGQALIAAELPEGSLRIGIQIPTTALFAEDDTNTSYVWVINRTTNQLERRAVQTGDLSEFGILVREGLQSGEWIVVAGATLVTEGEEVRILDAPEESAPQ